MHWYGRQINLCEKFYNSMTNGVVAINIPLSKYQAYMTNGVAATEKIIKESECGCQTMNKGQSKQ